jgi:hypothetical protein
MTRQRPTVRAGVVCSSMVIARVAENTKEAKDENSKPCCGEDPRSHRAVTDFCGGRINIGESDKPLTGYPGRLVSETDPLIFKRKGSFSSQESLLDQFHDFGIGNAMADWEKVHTFHCLRNSYWCKTVVPNQ